MNRKNSKRIFATALAIILVAAMLLGVLAPFARIFM